MDVLALYQPRANAPLDDLAQLAGFPGKLGMDGAQVWDAYQAGEIGDDPQLLRDRRRQHLSALPALPADARRVRPPSSYARGMRPGARRAGEARRAALARVPRRSGRPDPRASTSLDCRGPRRGAQRRRQGRVRRGRAAAASGSLSGCSERKPKFELAQGDRDPASRRRPARAALPALRRLRRLRHAARRRAHAGGRQAARAGGQPGAHRQGAGRDACCPSSTARSGATATARACRCATCRARAARWSASASGARATSPTCASARCCRRAFPR